MQPNKRLPIERRSPIRAVLRQHADVDLADARRVRRGENRYHKWAVRLM